MPKRKKGKLFASFNGVGFTYPELYSALFGTDVPLRDFALDKLRIVEQLKEREVCRSEYCRYFSSVELKSGQKFVPNCRSWRCPKCRPTWGRMWSGVISEQLELTPATLLVNLTTAEMIDNTTASNALRRFIKGWRRSFGPTEYVKVVEYNKNHTQPHFHLILCCSEYKPEKMPFNFPKKLSWPEDTFDFISGMWREALEFYAPDLKPTTVTWCQPPQSGPAATRYAVGYVTGKSLDKNEEPDSTWKGRKLTNSAHFFFEPTKKIWLKLLERWFPDRDPNPIFGLEINQEESKFAGIPHHLMTKEVKAKLALTSYYRDYKRPPPTWDVHAEITQDDTPQYSFEIIEAKEKAPYQRNFNRGRVSRALKEMYSDGAHTRLCSPFSPRRAAALAAFDMPPLQQ
jgi:hypothetical protein